MTKGIEEYTWPIRMTMSKLAHELAQKENISLDKAEEKAKEIVLNPKEWSFGLAKDMLTYTIVGKEKISFDEARKKVEKSLLESREISKKFIDGMDNIVERILREENISFRAAEVIIKEMIYVCIEEEVIKEAGLEGTVKKLEKETRKST